MLEYDKATKPEIESRKKGEMTKKRKIGEEKKKVKNEWTGENKRREKKEGKREGKVLWER